MTSAQGTAEYMAPEQLNPEAGLGPKADIWAFGATLVHMLSGSPPYAGSNLAQIALKVAVQRQQPELPWQVHANPALAQLLQGCFAYDPGARPSAEEALQLLGEAMAAAGVVDAAGRASPKSRNRATYGLASSNSIAAAGGASSIDAMFDLLAARHTGKSVSSTACNTPASSSTLPLTGRPKAGPRRTSRLGVTSSNSDCTGEADSDGTGEMLDRRHNVPGSAGSTAASGSSGAPTGVAASNSSSSAQGLADVLQSELRIGGKKPLASNDSDQLIPQPQPGSMVLDQADQQVQHDPQSNEQQPKQQQRLRMKQQHSGPIFITGQPRTLQDGTRPPAKQGHHSGNCAPAADAPTTTQRAQPEPYQEDSKPEQAFDTRAPALNEKTIAVGAGRWHALAGGMHFAAANPKCTCCNA